MAFQADGGLTGRKAALPCLRLVGAGRSVLHRDARSAYDERLRDVITDCLCQAQTNPGRAAAYCSSRNISSCSATVWKVPAPEGICSSGFKSALSSHTVG